MRGARSAAPARGDNGVEGTPPPSSQAPTVVPTTPLLGREPVDLFLADGSSPAKESTTPVVPEQSVSTVGASPDAAGSVDDQVEEVAEAAAGGEDAWSDSESMAVDAGGKKVRLVSSDHG